MNISQYLTKKNIGIGAFGAVIVGIASYVGCISCRQQSNQTPITPQQTYVAEQTKSTAQPATTQIATELATLPQKLAEDKEPTTLETKLQLPQVMYVEIGNRNIHKDLYAELSDVLMNGVSKRVLENSSQNSGFKVTNYKGNPNVVVNKYGKAQVVLHTDSQSITGISTPVKFTGYPSSPDIWSFELEPRSELAEGFKATGNPMDISDKAYALCFNNNPILFTDYDGDGTFTLEGVFADLDNNGDSETFIDVSGPDDEFITQRDGDFGFGGRVKLTKIKPKPIEPDPVTIGNKTNGKKF